MAGGSIPGSSTRCNECARRRKKCDQRTPQCGPCRKRGTICSGQRDATTFVHRVTKNFTSETPREVLLNAFRGRKGTKDASPVSADQFYRSIAVNVRLLNAALARHEWNTTLGSTFALATRQTSAHTIYVALLDEFKASRPIGIFGSDRVGLPPGAAAQPSNVATCIRALLPFAMTSNAVLDRSIFSLLALYYALLHSESGLAKLARSSYATTLGHYSHHLAVTMAHDEQGAEARYPGLICASVALQILELLNDEDLKEAGQLTHLNGVMSLLQTTGPAALQNDANVGAVFSGFRGMAAFMDIGRRRPSFLAQPDWRFQPFSNVEKTMRDRLADIGLQTPIYLQASDDILRNAHAQNLRPVYVVDRCLSLLNDTSSLQRRFEEWLCDLRLSVPMKLFHSRYSPLAEPFDRRDPECKPKYTSTSQRLAFVSGPVAGMLCHCWAFQLELLMVRIELQEAVLQLADENTSMEKDHIQSSWKKDRFEAEETADMIMQSEPRLSSCIEGLLGLRGPMRTLTRYYEESRLTSIQVEGAMAAK